jgi:hypothetical protein
VRASNTGHTIIFSQTYPRSSPNRAQESDLRRAILRQDKYRKAWTDPRTGVTCFHQRKEHS